MSSIRVIQDKEIFGQRYLCCALPWPLGALLLLAGGCGEPPAPGAPFCSSVAVVEATLEPPPAAISDVFVETWVELLTAPPMRGRRAGSAATRATAAALARQAAELDLTPPFAGDFCQPFALLGGLESNVVAHLPAADRSRPAVLIAAHYDGQGTHPAGAIYPGADDNASGTAALLEIARRARLRPRHERTNELVFAAFAAEEIGQLGARAYLAEPSVALDRLRLTIHLDMVGRRPDGQTAIGYAISGADSGGLARQLEQAAKLAGLTLRPLAELTAGEAFKTDAEVFSTTFPTLLLSTGPHADQHQTSDSVDKIDFAQIERTASLVTELLERWISDDSTAGHNR